jgi:pyruvate formate lyase activating enzyme
LKEALYYQTEKDQQVRCFLCPHHCLLKPDQKGICRVRVNQDGLLYSLNYGRLTSLALDPIEKKPLYHFYPGSQIVSAGTFGCNLACSFCQNHTIAHQEPETQWLSPQDLVLIADRYRPQGSIGVAFTYNEPSIWFEYVRDCAELLQAHEQQVVLVTNGYIEAEPLEELLPFIGAMNIDVKAFQDGFYRKLCKASLAEVKERVEQAAQQTHVEVTTLIIPGENDSLPEIESLAAWLASIDETIPLHLSRYHPAYRLDRPSTPEKTMLAAQERAQKYLKFVYLGNIAAGNNQTNCLECGRLLIDRSGYQTRIAGLQNGRCPQCGSEASYIIGK